MAGDERQLRDELLDAARGIPPRTSSWNRDQSLGPYFAGTGSQNIWLMRFAVQVLRGRAGDRPGHSGASLAPAVYAYQLGHAAAGLSSDASLTDVGEVVPIRPAFGGSEFMSTIYWPWHLMSHVALMRAREPEIAALARRWVVLNWMLFRAITAPDGSLMLFGQRSAGHVPLPREIDWIFALASGGDLERAEKWCKVMGAGLRDSWEREIALELQPELEASWRESLAVPIEDLQTFMPLKVPTEILRTAEGIAVVHAQTCNANTPPILAGTCDLFGRRVVCPTSVGSKGEPIPGGVRIRQKFDHATARIEGGEIAYQSSLYTGGIEVRIPLPGGEVLYHLKLGAGAASAPPTEPITGTVTPPPPAPPTSPADALSRAADLLAGLTLAPKHRGSRDAIVAAIREGRDHAPFLEIVRRWFRPDSPQAQAAQWREALAILEAHT